MSAPEEDQSGTNAIEGARPILPIPPGPMVLLVWLILAGAVGLVYYWSSDAPFIFDDVVCVVNNPSIMRLSPLWGEAGSSPLRPPQDFTTAGRPLVNLTFALNIFAGGLRTNGFHFVNALIHLSSAVLIWGIVRRALCLDYFGGRYLTVAGCSRFSRRSSGRCILCRQKRSNTSRSAPS